MCLTGRDRSLNGYSTLRTQNSTLFVLGELPNPGKLTHTDKPHVGRLFKLHNYLVKEREPDGNQSQITTQGTPYPGDQINKKNVR